LESEVGDGMAIAESECCVSEAFIGLWKGADIRIAMVVIGQMDGPIARTDAHLHCIVSIVYRLRIVSEDQCLPWPGRELPAREVYVQGLGGSWVEEAVKGRILPAVEGGNGVLLEGVAIEDASSVAGVRAKDGDAGLRKHCGRRL